jgi:hypothetical protein
MELITWTVIIPASVAALLTGLVQSLGTTWGLFRHYWVVAKLGLTVLATAILLVHTQLIGRVAAAAAESTLSGGDLHNLRIQLIADAGAGLVALLAATVLSVYKPWGLTRYDLDHGDVAIQTVRRAAPNAVWRVLWIAGVIAAIALFVVLHLVSGGMSHH